MSSNSFKVKNSLVLTPKDLSTLVSPEAGDLACDINDGNKIKRYDAASASWVEVGSGGGVGGVDILFVQDFESALLSSFTQTGLVLSQTDPLKGKVSAVLTHQAAINQSFKQIIPVDRKFRGESVTISLDAKSSASQGNLVIKITNETASTDIVASEQLVVSNDVSGAKSSVTFTIPSTCASLSYTITALPQAGSPVSRIDDIICQLTQSVTIQSGLIQDMDSQIRLSGANGFGSTAATTRRFSTASMVTRGDAISLDDSATLGSRFIAQKAGIYNVSYSEMSNTNTQYSSVIINLNGTVVATSNQVYNTAATLNKTCSTSWSGYLSVGDVITASVSSASENNGAFCYFSITQQGSLKQVTPNSNQKAVIPTSELRFEGATARGSTDTAIVLFSTQSLIRGDAFSVNSTAANGTVVTMLKPGRLLVSAGIYSSAVSVTFSVSKNQATRTLIAVQSEIIATGLSTTGNSGGCSGVIDVVAGDVIRVSSTATPTTGAPNFLQLSFQEQQVQVSVSNTLPQFSESDSYVRATTGNGFGSSSTNLRRFSSITNNIGSDIIYLDSPTLGASFTVQSAGIYSISYSDVSSSSTPSIQIFANGVSLANGTISTATGGTTISVQPYLSVGDVITVGSQQPGLISSSAGACQLLISKVGKPNVTGVNVTPFINVPQSDTEFLSATGGSGANAIVNNFSGLSSTSKGIISQTSSRLTALKRCNFSLFVRATSGGAGNRIDIYKNGSLYVTGSTIGSGSMLNQVSLLANAGDYFEVYSLGAGGNTGIAYEANAEALSDSILTAPETFSTDTAALTYASLAQYTLSTLANAPVGTFITFTYAANTNTRTQTTTAPSQSTSDMNANGILLYPRAYTAPSSAAQPAVFAIQIGKGLKGVSRNLYKAAGKVTAGTTDLFFPSTSLMYGAQVDYNENTGVLVVDAGFIPGGSATTHAFVFTDSTDQTSGYLVINASKNPALTGFGLNRIAARVTTSLGTSIPNTTDTQIPFDSIKVFDTTGSFNTATGVYTAPETGYYVVGANLMSASVAWSAGQIFQVFYKKNNSSQITFNRLVIQASSTQLIQAGGQDMVYLNKGDTISFFVYQTRGAATALHTDPAFNYAYVTKVSV